ncbi:MAG: DegQ family serine endoprotease [Deltaproteobacteria bacterium]|nr:DegQ family serine endoprotease [Deltaproteobacteria bacterium]MBI2181457.1 DegQ family serine endoprotease [Deltaproteobacteria bacterium]MBI2231852.1 DegQ family serine endoprotease [Deltaproteobacteria bacterium]MBI2366227.1 DegQ family serine endoprotease [Deltaproteobacteria bacterium]MBI2534776.1 DegQ family serine endoprotease [Deltaproteobacteria bacterium]
MNLNSIWRGDVSFKGVILVALVSLVVGLGISGSLDWLAPSRAVNLTGEAGNADPRPNQLPDFVVLAKKLKPLVVNISTTQVSEGRGSQEFGSPFGDEDPFNDFWRRFFGGPAPRGPQRQRSLGSGFIIDGDGSILTNNHVVENAQKIVVKLAADDQQYEAKVIGRDPKTDIAVIKINAKTSLPTATLGDSDRLEVGEWVVAIGNPFGLDSTVTSGIVSAKGRHIGQGPYDNFIQTDASINPGNSGGPLINLRGEVIGINTAIFSRTGGNMGIGFAIPINLVKEVLPQLRGKGKVTRGFLGVLIQKVTPEIAESLGMDKGYGALVANVTKDGPADKAGVKVGDVIVEFDGKEVKDSSDLPIIVARTPVDKRARMKVLRDKKEISLTVSVGELKDEEVVASAPEKGELGLTVQRLTPQMAESLGLDRTEGVVVSAVEPGSAADEAGIRRGDVIMEVDRKAIRNLDEYKKAVAGIRKGRGVLFLVRRGDSTLFLALKPQR